jgi:hypothetical protein
MFVGYGCGDDDRIGDRTTDVPGADMSLPPGVDGGPPRDWGPRGSDGCDKMDILFVIDDSGSMGEEQANLVSNFPRFIEILDAYRTDTGNPLDYRLGVTTTGKDFTTVVNFGAGFPPMTIAETGPNGELLQECGMPRKWIESADSDVSGTFSCVAEVGTGGSSVEMPLLMTETALTTRVADGTNAGFLREDALLAVVILTDEDDCSRPEDMVEITIDPFDPAAGAADECDPEFTMPVSRFLDALDGVKGDRGRWAGAIIAGPTDCSSSFGDAVAATRLQQFASEAGDNVVFSSICEGDLSGALMNAIDTFEAACDAFPPLI